MLTLLTLFAHLVQGELTIHGSEVDIIHNRQMSFRRNDFEDDFYDIFVMPSRLYVTFIVFYAVHDSKASRYLKPVRDT